MITQWNFVNCKSDSSLSYKWDKGHILLVLMYVDDIIITGSNSLSVLQVISYMQATFALKDLGKLSYFLGVEVTKTKEGIHLSQSKYIADLLAKQGMIAAVQYLHQWLLLIRSQNTQALKLTIPISKEVLLGHCNM